MVTAQGILEEYESGLYTENETISRTIDALLDSPHRDELWQSLPDWISIRIDGILDRFSPGDELMTFGHVDPKIAREGLLELKRWRGRS